MSSPTYISDSRVKELLNWDKVYEAVETAFISTTNNELFQSARIALPLANTGNVMLAMPGYISDQKYGGLSCKLLRVFPNKPKRDSSVIVLMDEENGQLKAVVEGTQITEWRTAAASAVATKYACFSNPNKKGAILAILGAGTQGRAHALAFRHFFEFQEVRIWNRTPSRAQKLVEELNQNSNLCATFVACSSVEEAVTNADVIVTATTGDQTLVKLKWLKRGVHINALAVNPFNRELEDAVYKAASVYVDQMSEARKQLVGISNLGVEFKGQIGDLVVGSVPVADSETITVFQSLGMAIQDCVTGRLVYDLHVGKINL